ncbi:MAG: 5' nucleotidase, NT5C type [Desulfatibacillaceae bacterium]
MGDISPESIAFDVDGVVADTMELFLAIARDRYGIDRYTVGDITSYNLDECLDIEPDTLTNIVMDLLDGNSEHALAPNPGAREFFSDLAGLHRPLVFVTARPTDSLIRDWLEKQLPVRSEDIDLTATGSFEAKTGVLREKGRTWFVEDRLDTCFLLAEAGMNPIVFRQPWNREPHPFMEIGSFEELRERMAL